VRACVDAAIKAGATTINLPDTVGYTVPDEMRHLFKTVRENVANSDKAVFSAHCHNDLGMAVANSLAAIEGGVRQIECTINGWVSGPATRRWKRSSWPSAPATTCCPMPAT
jgi:2-isopropylmalate synthase